MYTCVEIKWKTPSDEKAEIIIALLGELPFDTFENTSKSINAYMPSKFFDATITDELNILKNHYDFKFITHSIPFTNWNAEWEKNYEPVIVGNFVGVRADFHVPILNIEHEIIINPRMAFGTGHHATTFSVMEMMQSIDFKNKTVLDFGCGSGILAILAEKLGAKFCYAIDNDENCIENTIENAEINHCKNIKTCRAAMPGGSNSEDIKHGGSKKFDIIIANINRNVLMSTMQNMASLLSKNGQLIISGFYNADEKLLINCAQENKLHVNSVKQKDGWSCILLS